MPYNKVLIAVDNSAFSLGTGKAGFELASLSKATIALVFVIDKNKEVINGDLGITPEQSATALLRQAEDSIVQLIKLYGGAEKVFHFMPEGFPKKEIMKTAKEWGADVIVMGSHGRTGFSGMLIGSVADYVIKHAGIPVLIIPRNHDW